MKKLLQTLLLLPLFVLGACGGSGGGNSGGQTPVNHNPPTYNPPTNNPPAATNPLFSTWSLSSTNAPSGAYIITNLNLTSESSTPFTALVLYSTGCLTSLTFQSTTVKEVVPSSCTLVGPGTFYAFWSVNNNILKISWDPQGGRVDYYTQP